ncbi:MAG: tRNA pseudouridine(38-40) synthase TruA [Desulfatibacillaceae bacterium]
MAKTFLLTIEYDGTDFHGWQRQAGDATVQETLERALGTMLRRDVVVHGSGRTDAGVHALGQCAHFRADTAITAEAFRAGLNSLLPSDVVVLECREVPEDFHARKSATGKVYEYHVLNRRLRPAVGRQYAWHVRKALGVAAMERAAACIVGEHDFAAFESTGSPRATSVRKVTRSGIEVFGDTLVYTVSANGFLRYMVRSIVGTLVHVGVGRISAGDVPGILESRNRALAGPTAPAHGLFLRRVLYD